MNASASTAPARTSADPILEVSGLGVDFWVENSWVPAAENVSFTLNPGEVLAIVGESGSGKTTSSMALLGLLPTNGRSSGSVKLAGEELIGMPMSKLRKVRGNKIAVIFQEPMTALNPVYTVGFQIVEAIQIHSYMTKAEARFGATEHRACVMLEEADQFHFLRTWRGERGARKCVAGATRAKSINSGVAATCIWLSVVHPTKT